MNFWITLFLCILLLFLIRIIYVRYCVRPIVRGSVVFREKFCFFTNIIQLRRASSSNSGPANRSESLAPYFIRLRAMRDREASLAQQSQVTLTSVSVFADVDCNCDLALFLVVPQH